MTIVFQVVLDFLERQDCLARLAQEVFQDLLASPVSLGHPDSQVRVVSQASPDQQEERVRKCEHTNIRNRIHQIFSLFCKRHVFLFQGFPVSRVHQDSQATQDLQDQEDSQGVPEGLVDKDSLGLLVFLGFLDHLDSQEDQVSLVDKDGLVHQAIQALEVGLIFKRSDKLVACVCLFLQCGHCSSSQADLQVFFTFVTFAPQGVESNFELYVCTCL